MSDHKASHKQRSAIKAYQETMALSITDPRVSAAIIQLKQAGLDVFTTEDGLYIGEKKPNGKTTLHKLPEIPKLDIKA